MAEPTTKQTSDTNQTNNTAQKKKKQLKHPLAVAGSAFFGFFLLLVVIITLATFPEFYTYGGDKTCNYPYCQSKKAGGFSVLTGTADYKFRESEAYSVNGQSYERTTTGLVPKKDTYLVLEDDKIKVEDEWHWEEREYSDGTGHYTRLEAAYCERHKEAEEALLRAELYRVRLWHNPVVLVLAALTALPWVLVAINKLRKKEWKGLLILLPIAALAAAVLVLPDALEKQLTKGARQDAYDYATSLLAEGKYGEAASFFQGLGFYQDSRDLANEASYQQAMELMKIGERDDAIALFKTLGDYKDSASHIEDMTNQKLEAQYQAALAPLKQATPMTVDQIVYDAADELAKLKDYKDSEALAQQLWDELAAYREAYDAFSVGDRDTVLSISESNQYVTVPKSLVDRANYIAPFQGQWTFLSGDPKAPSMTSSNSARYYDVESFTTVFFCSEPETGDNGSLYLLPTGSKAQISFSVSNGGYRSTELSGKTYSWGTQVASHFTLELTDRDTLVVTARLKLTDEGVTAEYQRAE